MDVILVVVDRLTKSAHFLPLPHPYTVQDVVEIHKLHGMPISLITDGTKSLPATASPKYSHLTETQYSPSPVEERVNQSEWWTGGTIANATTFQGLCVFHPPQIGEFSVPCNVSEKGKGNYSEKGRNPSQTEGESASGPNQNQTEGQSTNHPRRRSWSSSSFGREQGKGCRGCHVPKRL